MTAEHILDAMDALPDYLLEQTDTLRSRKPVRWKPWVTAACLVLVMGLACSFWAGPAEKADDMVGDVGEDGALMDKAESGSTTGDWWVATVTAVDDTSVAVRLESGEEVTVVLVALEERPSLKLGQRIRIYLKEAEIPLDGILKPYKIEIEEE